MKKFLKCFISLLFIIILVGCKNEDITIEKISNNNDDISKKVNIVDESDNSRPYAVMINTHDSALPQCGLDKAYIVYELMVEGGITRMMALFKGVDVDKIGSVRSARAQYLPYVMENDAIYAHAGGSAEATIMIASNDLIDDVDVDGVYGVRDTTLNRAWEHTLFTSTSLIKQGMERYGYSSTTEKGNLLKYSVDEIDLSNYADSTVANNVSIVYSDYRTSNYVYDSNSKKYLRSLNDTKNVDLVTNQQYEVKNIIAYAVQYTTYTDHGYSGYQKISNIGTGEGYYISNGYSIPITWEKTDDASKTIYKVKATGEELIVNDGNTYIQIYPLSGSMSIS